MSGVSYHLGNLIHDANDNGRLSQTILAMVPHFPRELVAVLVTQIILRADNELASLIAEMAVARLDELEGDTDLEDGCDAEGDTWASRIDCPDEVFVNNRTPAAWRPGGDALSR